MTHDVAMPEPLRDRLALLLASPDPQEMTGRGWVCTAPALLTLEARRQTILPPLMLSWAAYRHERVCGDYEQAGILKQLSEMKR